MPPWCFTYYIFWMIHPAVIWMFQFNKENTTARLGICWKLTIKIIKCHHWRRSTSFLLTLNILTICSSVLFCFCFFLFVFFLLWIGKCQLFKLQKYKVSISFFPLAAILQTVYLRYLNSLTNLELSRIFRASIL